VVVGTYIPNAARNDILEITAILAATAVAVALFNVVKGIAMVRMEGRMDLSVQAAVWDRLLALPVPFFKQFTAGDLAVRSLGIGAIREILSGATLNALLTLIFTSFNLLFLFVYDWQMAMVAVALTGLGALVTLVAAAVTIYYQKTLFEIQGRISGTLLQFICGIAKLRSTGAEDRAFSVLAQAYVRQGRLNFRAGSVDAALIAFNAAFPVLVSMVIFAWYYWVRPGHLPIAGFVAFTSAYSAFQIALLQVSMVMPQTANVIPLYQRARPIFDTLPECDAARKPPGPLTGAVEISHARFRYSPDGPLILDDVSIRAARGEFIAIVGGSGAGKSTLLRLLLGFETPASGGVFFDQQELKHLDVREVRRQIGVVLQNGKLMSGDIYRNIVGIANLTMEDAWEAARRVGLAEDIAAMPMKMHTIIPAGGGSLSGGQRQRLLIARAIANHPRMLFFDEATSALDNVTQAIVSRSLAELSVTRIVIAHRLSTILHADRIYVMHGGKVVEEGNYDALMTRQGYFYDQARRQIS
jgi:ATP-binding cassette subfamily C protein